MDFVVPGGRGLVAVEVKRRGRRTGQIHKFKRKFGRRASGFIVDPEDEGVQDGINIVPAWRLMLGD